MKILSRIKWTGLALVMLSVADVDAVVLVYEGFDYSLANNATINGASATGFGLQGNWAVTNDLPKNGSNSGSASSVYQTSGLSFGTAFAPTEAGSVKLNTLAHVSPSLLDLN